MRCKHTNSLAMKYFIIEFENSSSENIRYIHRYVHLPKHYQTNQTPYLENYPTLLCEQKQKIENALKSLERFIKQFIMYTQIP